MLNWNPLMSKLLGTETKLFEKILRFKNNVRTCSYTLDFTKIHDLKEPARDFFNSQRNLG